MIQSDHLHLHNIAKSFVSPRGKVDALHNLNFRVASNEFVAIVGPSGCGKSTILRLTAGLLEPDAGEILFNGWQRPPKIRLVFQDHALFPWMTVAENVAFGLEMDGVPGKQGREQAVAQLTQMGLAAFADHYPHELSGGMRQRAAIARAWITRPDILLMDEPFRALDAQTRLVLQEELLRIWQERQRMVIYVTHDIEEALMLADRVLVMSGRPGQIREEIRPQLGRPRSLTARTHGEIEEMKWHIWKLLEKEVRQELLGSGH